MNQNKTKNERIAALEKEIERTMQKDASLNDKINAVALRRDRLESQVNEDLRDHSKTLYNFKERIGKLEGSVDELKKIANDIGRRLCVLKKTNETEWNGFVSEEAAPKENVPGIYMVVSCSSDSSIEWRRDDSHSCWCPLTHNSDQVVSKDLAPLLYKGQGVLYIMRKSYEDTKSLLQVLRGDNMRTHIAQIQPGCFAQVELGAELSSIVVGAA